jgi:hypothetical protein
MYHKKLGLLAFLATMGVLVGCSTGGTGRVETASTSQAITPYVVDGNPTCADLGLGRYSFKVEFPGPGPGTYVIDAAGNTITITSTDGIHFDWSSTLGMDAVLAKGGPMAYVYAYDPESLGDSGLTPPINISNGTPYGISHIDFCFDYEVKVEKTAETSFTRSYGWTLEKSADTSELLLATGQQYLVSYTVTASLGGYTDSDFAVAGTIVVTNPAPEPATVEAVVDVLDGAVALPVDCGVAFPVQLAPGAELVCTYGSDLADASSHLNVATALTSGFVGPGSGSAAVDFGAAEMAEVDACITVDDTLQGGLGTVCLETVPHAFQYALYLGGYAVCGEYTVDNVASFVADDSGATGSASWSVAIDVACSEGCSLTPGYWKTHSSYGPAPDDDTWALLPQGADTAFFLSGKSYYQVLWTAPLGNAYYVLAHAFIAARLNGLNGADLGAVAGEMQSAQSVFEAYTPAIVGSLKKSSALRAYIISLATTLDAYNNGLIGPGHCSE